MLKMLMPGINVIIVSRIGLILGQEIECFS